jgi:hypothetical protein
LLGNGNIKPFLGNEYVRKNRIIGRAFSMRSVRIVSKESRRIVLPRTSCYIYDSSDCPMFNKILVASVCQRGSDWVPARVTSSRGEVTNSGQNPPFVEEEAPFQNTQKSWKEQNYGLRNQDWLCCRGQMQFTEPILASAFSCKFCTG